jgi:putative transposase
MVTSPRSVKRVREPPPQGNSSRIKPHSQYLSLGDTKEDRSYVYRSLFSIEIPTENLHLIRKAAHYRQPVAGDFFCRQIEEKYGISRGYIKRGRPKKAQPA